MADINTGRFNRTLQRLLQLKGDAPSPELGGEISPTIVLENDRPEFAFLGGVRLGVAYGSVPAGGAGNRSQVLLINPASSGVLVIVERILCMTAGANVNFSIRHNVSVTGFTQVTTTRPRDVRWGSIVPTAQVYTRNNGALVAGTLVGLMPGIANGAGSGCVIEGPWVLPPDLASARASLCIDPSNDNVDLTVTFLWRERGIEASETTAL